MNIKKSKIVLALGSFLFLSVPLSSAFADQKHCEMSGTMKSMKSELRGYVNSFKSDDAQKMQQHTNELLQLSEKAVNETPVNINVMKDMPEMDHSQMDMKDMPEIDHSKMDHGDMNMDSPDHNMATMPTMEGMSNAEHHQHMMYMQSMTGLNDLFKELDKTQDKDEIKVILGKIKEHSKKNQLFRKQCS
jgi:hypothetical protein